MTTAEKVNMIKGLIKSHGNKFMTVDFRKKDGSLRHMCLHRSKVLEGSVKDTAPESTEARKATLKRQNMALVEELVKPGENGHQWRTINLETVEKVCCAGREYAF